MLSHPIIKSLIILSAFVASIYSDTCKYFKEPKYCSSYVLRSKKNNERSYVSPLIYKSKTNKKIETQDEFNQYMDNLAYNPVYPLDLKIFEEDFGCPNYDYNKFKVRYVNSYQCNYIYYKDCNTKVLDKLPKLCKNSCDAYLKSITEIFSNKESCPTTATVEQLTNRENKLNEIREHCSNTTYSRTENCLLGVGDELKYCGYKYEKDFIEYCNKNINEPCCQQEIEEKGDSILLKIILYAFIGVVVLLIVVLMVLKIYSVNKNRKDEISRSRIQEIEKRRDYERDKYREQLSKEVSSDSINIPLLQRNPSSPAYQNQGTPVLSPNARPTNNPPFPQRNGTQPKSPFPPRGVTKPKNENPFIQRNGSLPPQQNYPPQNRPFPGPGTATVPRPPPTANTLGNPRDSPRYGASRPPAPGNLPRSGSGYTQNRPPPRW